MSVYLHLFHGRKTVDEQLNDWGSDGPTIGPFNFAHTTYAEEIKLGYCGDVYQSLNIVEGLVYYDGLYYGDWSIFVPEHIEKLTVTPFDPAKAKLPEPAPPAVPGDLVGEMVQFISRVTTYNGIDYVQDVYFALDGTGCVPDSYIGDDLLADIREKLLYPLQAMGEKAAEDLGMNTANIEYVIDPSFDDCTICLLRHRQTGQELYCYHCKAWHFRFDSRDEFNEFLSEVYKTVRQNLQR